MQLEKMRFCNLVFTLYYIVGIIMYFVSQASGTVVLACVKCTSVYI